MALPRLVVRIANASMNAAIIAGVPRPPYTRKNALVVETIGRRSGARYRIPVGYLDDNGRTIVMLEVEPEAYLRRMNRVHAGLVRSHSSTPGFAELVLE